VRGTCGSGFTTLVSFRIISIDCALLELSGGENEGHGITLKFVLQHLDKVSKLNHLECFEYIGRGDAFVLFG
jgi:hypothetical protein